MIIDDALAEVRSSLNWIHLEYNRIGSSLRSKIPRNKHATVLEIGLIEVTSLAYILLWGRTSEYSTVLGLQVVVRVPVGAMLWQDLVDTVLHNLFLDLDVID